MDQEYHFRFSSFKKTKAIFYSYKVTILTFSACMGNSLLFLFMQELSAALAAAMLVLLTGGCCTSMLTVILKAYCHLGLIVPCYFFFHKKELVCFNI